MSSVLAVAESATAVVAGAVPFPLPAVLAVAESAAGVAAVAADIAVAAPAPWLIFLSAAEVVSALALASAASAAYRASYSPLAFLKCCVEEGAHLRASHAPGGQVGGGSADLALREGSADRSLRGQNVGLPPVEGSVAASATPWGLGLQHCFASSGLC